jgi:hypothetical protein
MENGRYVPCFESFDARCFLEKKLAASMERMCCYVCSTNKSTGKERALLDVDGDYLLLAKFYIMRGLKSCDWILGNLLEK